MRMREVARVVGAGHDVRKYIGITVILRRSDRTVVNDTLAFYHIAG